MFGQIIIMYMQLLSRPWKYKTNSAHVNSMAIEIQGKNSAHVNSMAIEIQYKNSTHANSTAIEMQYKNSAHVNSTAGLGKI